MMTGLGEAGSWASIAGLFVSLLSLGISGYIAVRVRQISRRIVFNARADEIIGEIEDDARWLQNRLNETPSLQSRDREAEERMYRCIASIKRVDTSLPSDIRKYVRELIRSHEQYHRYRKEVQTRQIDSERRELMWDMLNQVKVIIRMATHSVAERRLGASDDL